jgi:hypothetical protein
VWVRWLVVYTVLGATAGLISLAAFTVPAEASPPAPRTATVTAALTAVMPVRSVTVSATSISYTNCKTSGGTPTPSGLHFPNGHCTAALTVTNGPTSGQILVASSPFTPSDGGATWEPCGFSQVVCGGGGQPAAPGLDQVHLTIGGRVTAGAHAACLVPAIQDDTCDIAANRTVQAGLSVIGPADSTDPSSSWHNVLTFTAAP